MRTRIVIAALAIPVALLSACGDDDGDATDPGTGDSTSESASDTPTDAPTATPSEATEATETLDPSADWPVCPSVWKDGARLPSGYAGCREGDQGVQADRTGCSFGRPIVTYVDRFYGVPSGIIHETAGPLAKDRGYRSAMASCRA